MLAATATLAASIPMSCPANRGIEGDNRIYQRTNILHIVALDVSIVGLEWPIR